MQKQKTLAKWLAIILLCSVAVGSYVLYDALYLKKQSGGASADNGQMGKVDYTTTENTDTPTSPEHIPYYTTLPRKSETIDNFTVTHFGGEGDDLLLDVISFGKKRFAVFSSNSVEFDMREKGLSVAIIDGGVERVTTLSQNETYIDGKMSSKGVAILTQNDNGGRLYFVGINGDITADITLNYFTAGKLYLSGQNLLLFTIANGYLNCYKIADNLTITKSPFIIKTTCPNINQIFDTQGGLGLILNNINGVEICTFDQNNGFNIPFQENKLSFEQIITAGSSSDCNYVLYGNLDGKPWLYSFDTEFQMVASKCITGVDCGVIMPYSDGLVFIGNGVTKSYCKHLDEVGIAENNLSFKNVVNSTYGSGSILVIVDDGFGDKTMFYADGEILLSTTINFDEIVDIKSFFNGFSIYVNTSSTTGIFRANFGKTDPYILDFDLSHFVY